MKRAVFAGLGTLLGLLVVATAHQVMTHWIILNPGSILKYSFAYREFRVHSDVPPDPAALEPVLDNVNRRLHNVLDDDSGPYQLFLVHDAETFEKFALEAGRAPNIQGFNLQPLNHVFINLSFIRQTRLRNTDGHRYSILEGNESHIIAHEICHELIARKIGFFRMRKTERWKQEGYCEYATTLNLKNADPSYRFEDLAAAYFGGRFDRYEAGRQFYISSQLAVEYLLDRKNVTFEELMNREYVKSEILREVKTLAMKEM